MIKSRKASMFAIGLVLITLIAMVYALGRFVLITGEIEGSVSPPNELIDAYDKKTKFLFYAQESARLAAQEAFNFIAKEKAATPSDTGETGECKIRQEKYVEWSKNCKPDTETIKENFLEEFNKNYASFIDNYPTIEGISYNTILENGIMSIKAEEFTINIPAQESYIEYNSRFTFDPSITLDINKINIRLEDFTEIYSASQKCKGSNVTKAKSCMIEKIVEWSINAKIDNDYLLFDLETKQSFFYDDNFAPIELRFAIKL